MSYRELTIHQKISLKGIISSKQARIEIGICGHKFFDGLYALALINKSYEESINMFLKA